MNTVLTDDGKIALPIELRKHGKTSSFGALLSRFNPPAHDPFYSSCVSGSFPVGPTLLSGIVTETSITDPFAPLRTKHVYPPIMRVSKENGQISLGANEHA